MELIVMPSAERDREKSCGTVLYTRIKGKVHYLLLRATSGGDYGFPKGHIEQGETEEECALRETWEEVSISAKLLDGFRYEISYPISGGRIKTVTYFLASYEGQTPCHNAGFEHFRYYLVPYDKAIRMLTYENAREVLRAADAHLNNLIK